MAVFEAPCGVCGPCLDGVPAECEAAERRERFAALVEQEADVLAALSEDDQ